MIYHLKGIVEHTEPFLAVIDVQGVGYACHTSLTTIGKLKQGQQAKLFTYMYLREDVCDLYGFADNEELVAFKMLIGISGVGPKAAVSILSVLAPERLALSVLTDDEKALTAASGVGKKLAQRIILELKDKMGKQQGTITISGGSAQTQPLTGGKLGEAQAALSVLGYSPSEAAMALKGLDAEELPVEELVRQALRSLARL